MEKFLSRLQLLINRWFPERQIIIRGEDTVRATKLRPAHQCAVAAALGVLAIWSIISPLAFLTLWHGEAAAGQKARQLQVALAGTQAALGSVQAQNSALKAVSTNAIRQTSAFTNHAAAQIGALDAQTKAAIATVTGIIGATGINPARAERPQTAPSFAAARLPAEANAALLCQDLARLHALSAFLGKMPLAPPVEQMTMSSPFGYRPDPWTGAREFHTGIDLRGPEGTPIYATAPGTVSFAGDETGYGEIIVLDHGYGLSTRYSHLSRILVQPGQSVALHQLIGRMGNTGWSTGPHLLYETWLDGTPANPLNFLKVSENNVQE